tara:strand:+ start:572 stop:1993 length:1422 start_codon:yes stop_codon:yes gene_type:complete
VNARRSILGAEHALRADRCGLVRRWTQPQLDVFASPFHVTVWWGANGIGKSLGLAEAVRRALVSELPWQRPGPKVVILTGNTWSQLGATLGYLFESEARSWFREGVRFESGGVKGQRLAVYDIVSGPGKGGQLRLGTFRAANLAGPRADFVVADEPIPADVYDELWPRLLGRGGRMLMGFTTTIGTTNSVEWLWKMVDDPALPFIGEIHTPLTLEAVTPLGGLVVQSWMGTEEIERFEMGLNAISVEMRMGRSRHPVRDVAYFARVWGDHLIQRRRDLGAWSLGVGVDHGNKPGAQRAVLVAVDQRRIRAPVHVLSEYKATTSKTSDHAAGILAMLQAGGRILGVKLGVGSVDRWVGDRAHDRSSRGPKQSNRRLMRAMAVLLGLDVRASGWTEKLPAALRDMRTPRKRVASDWEGFEVLHEHMADALATLDPDVIHLREDIERWEGSRRDPCKDGLDALRYIAIPMISATTD